MAEGNSAYGRTRFRRSPSHFADRITADGRDGWPVAAGRYRLVVGRACPWASRAVIARRLLCNRHKLTEDPVLWAYAPDLCQTPGFGDTVDFDHIKRHYHRVHTGINPTGIVPLGPNLADWLASHGRERLGGRPFGDGTPPGPVPADEEVPAAGRRAGAEPRETRKERDVAKDKKSKPKLPLVYKPVGFALGWASGALAGVAFRRTWKALRHEDDAPDALDRDRGWGEILLAAAVQGALFAVARSVADRTGAKAIERSTGVWPAAVKGGRD